MNALMKDSPISLGLALEVLRARRMTAVGKARADLRNLRNAPGADQFQIELAENALEEAREAAVQAQRMTDDEARTILAAEGVALCKE